MIKKLQDQGIHTMIHYPVQPHLSAAYEDLGYKEGSFPIAEELADTCISLPIYNGLSEEHIEKIAGVLNE